MRILFVTPYPPSRIRTRSFGFLKELKREHEVTVLAQVWSPQEMADAEALRYQGYKVLTIQESLLQAGVRGCLAVLDTTHSLQVAYARSQRFLLEAQRLCSRRYFDIVHVEHLRGIASMLPLARYHPLVWDAVDCISLLYQQAATAGPSRFVRAITTLDYNRMQQYEANVLAQHVHTITTSERDRQELLDLSHKFARHELYSDEDAEIHCDVIPCGVDLEYFQPQPGQQRFPAQIVFFGKMSYHANIAAVHFLYQQIMPRIWQQQPEVRLAIIGDNPPLSIQRLTKDSRVEVTGYVEDLRPLITRARVMVCPMVYSVGLQNKVLEAMALGIPTVVTAQSALALQALQGRDLLVATSPEDFADCTLRLLQDADLHSMLSQYGRHYVEQYHNWRSITDCLVNVYQHVIAEFACKNAMLQPFQQYTYDTLYPGKVSTG